MPTDPQPAKVSSAMASSRSTSNSAMIENSASFTCTADAAAPSVHFASFVSPNTTPTLIANCRAQVRKNMLNLAHHGAEIDVRTLELASLGCATRHTDCRWLLHKILPPRHSHVSTSQKRQSKRNSKVSGLTGYANAAIDATNVNGRRCSWK